MKVTIGLPIYNVESYIKDTILSIIGQNFQDWECLVIDDGSTDNSLDIVRRYADHRFTIITDGENRGLVYRLNQITSLARGEYIARMDGDDIMHPDRINAQVNLLNELPQIDVVATLKYSIDLDNNVCRSDSTTVVKDRDLIYKILKSGLITHPTIMSRSSWAKNNLYDGKFIRAEDRELFARSIDVTNIRIIPLPLYYYREIGNMDLRKYTKGYETEFKVLIKYGPRRIGFARTGFLIARWIAKSLAIRVMFFLKIQERLRVDNTSNLYENIERTVYLKQFLRTVEVSLNLTASEGYL